MSVGANRQIRHVSWQCQNAITADTVLPVPGLRIDAEQMARSRMSYYTSLALVSMADDTIIPAPPEQQLPISGIAPGHWINFVTWSHDGATLAFTLRSAGAPGSPSHEAQPSPSSTPSWSFRRRHTWQF